MAVQLENIGKVSATEKNPTTADEFHFWLANQSIVSPFDIVAVPNRNGSTTYGQITEISHVTDSPSHIGNYVSSDFGSTSEVANTPRLGTTFARAEVLGNSKEIYMPVLDGQLVRFATREEVLAALGVDQIPSDHVAIPAGFIRLPSGERIVVSFDSYYLLGPDGAHLNISGISGLATKTSYTMFLIAAIHQRHPDAAVIVMNVKGEDLLHIDEPCEGEDATSTEAAWKECTLEFRPFTRTRYFYPFRGDERAYNASTFCNPATLRRQVEAGIAHNYIYTFEHDREKLGLFFANVDDPTHTIESMLRDIADGSAWEDVQSWEELLDAVQQKSSAGSTRSAESGIVVGSWRMFYRHLRRCLGDKSSLGSGIYQNARSSNAERRHVHLADEILDIKPGSVFVVDIAALSETEKYVVFGDVVDAMHRLRTERADAPPRVILFVDELNKYAPATPRGQESPIIQRLIDITERGRSQGIVLFGAEQFKSAVHQRVTGNCSNDVYGRTNSTEVSKPAYRAIPEAYRNILVRLPQGSLIVSHPRFPKLLRIEFPRPCYFQPKPR